MDIQVSLKVRSAIKAKLVELGLHIDEELPDYVMVLVANRRTKVQMEQDLQLFLGDNTVKFTSWLQHVLSKLEELTNATSTTVQKTQPASSSSAKTDTGEKSIKIISPGPKKKKDVGESKKKDKDKKVKAKDKEEKVKAKDKEQKVKAKEKEEKVKAKDKDKTRSSSTSSKSISEKKTPSRTQKEIGKQTKPAPAKRKEKLTSPVQEIQKPSKSDKKSSETTGKKRKAEKLDTELMVQNNKKPSTSNDSTVKFKFRKSETGKLPLKSALSQDEDTSPKRLLPLLDEKTPEREIKPPPTVQEEPTAKIDNEPVSKVNSKEEEEEEESTEEFKVPPVPIKKKGAAGAAMPDDDEVLSLNDADDDDFLKLDKEKEELEALRKKALESKNKSRNYIRTLKIGDRIVQKQKELEAQIKLEKEKEQKLLKQVEEEKQKQEAKTVANIKSVDADRNEESENIPDEITVSSSERKENVTSTSSTSRHSQNNVGSRIRSILISNREDIKNSRCDAREILEKRKLEHGRDSRRVERRRSIRNDERSPSPVVKKMKSAVGALIKRNKYCSDEEEYDPSKPDVKLSSVILVKARPKREKDASEKLLFRAVADAQKSIVSSTSKQYISKKRSRSRSRERERVRDSLRSRRSYNDDHMDSRRESYRFTVGRVRRLSRDDDEYPISRRRRTSDRGHSESESLRERKSIDKRKSEDMEKPIKKKSIHDRLGVKRTNYFEDLNESRHKEERDVSDPDDHDRAFNLRDSVRSSFDDDTKDDDMIVVSVPTSTVGRNVSLESMKERPRISIQLKHDDDTTDDEYDPVIPNLEAAKNNSRKSSTETKSDGGRSSDNDYIVEEIVQEETDDEIEVTVEDTSIKLPEPLEDSSANIEINQSQQVSDSQQAEHEQKQQEQLQSEVEIGQIMAKGPEIRTPSQPKQLITIKPDVASTSSVSEHTVFNNIRPRLPLSVGTTSTSNSTQPPGHCKFWPECQFKDKCMYNHPKCKFGDNCKNPKCVYKHSSIKLVSGGLQTSTFSNRTSDQQQCKYFPTCHSLSCPFFHPTPCKFGLGCNDEKCSNYHPGETLGQKKKKAGSSKAPNGLINNGRKYLPAAHLLKWSKSNA